MVFEYCILGIIVFILWVIWENDPFHKTPPGPIKFPILGSMIQLVRAHPEPHMAMDILGKKYGPVCSVKMGGRNAVIFTGFEDVKAMTQLPESQVAPRNFDGLFADRNMYQNLGIIWGFDPQYRKIRRFVLQTLTEFGFAKRSNMDFMVAEEVEEVTNEIKSRIASNSGIVHFEHFFRRMVLNFAWVPLTGQRIPKNDTQVEPLLDTCQRWVDSATMATGIDIAFPVVRTLFPSLVKYDVQQQCHKEFHQFFRQMLKNARAKYDPDAPHQSFLDRFVHEIELHENEPDTIFTENQFIISSLDIFQAGSETTTSAMNTVTLFMTRFPEMQKRVFEEIEKVAGFDRPPSLQDREQMPFTEAVCIEAIRWTCPSNYVPRRAASSFYYKDMLISENSLVIPNVFSLSRDEKVWGDPYVVRPDRFLTPDGKLDPNMTAKMVNFGTGKRACLGEPLARATFFLAFAAIMQRFAFQCVPGKPIPTLDLCYTLVLSTKPFDALVTERKLITY